jgi:hypothetical protein
MDQVVKSMPSKWEALSSNSSTTKKKKKKEKNLTKIYILNFWELV